MNHKARDKVYLLDCLQNSTFAAPILSTDKVHLRPAASLTLQTEQQLLNARGAWSKMADKQTDIVAYTTITKAPSEILETPKFADERILSAMHESMECQGKTTTKVKRNA